METNKWLFFGVPVALIALVLGATEFQRYRLAQPAKGQVEAGFSEAIAVFYPGTRLSNADKLDAAPLYCKMFECRLPATIIDDAGRTASIQVEGARSSNPVSISPDGKHVGIMDFHHVAHFTDGEFTTYDDGLEVWNSGRMVVDDQGDVQIIDQLWDKPGNGTSTPSARVRTYRADRVEQVTEGGYGNLYACDGKHMIIGALDTNRPAVPKKEYHLNPDTLIFESVRDLPELFDEDAVAAVCNHDGNGTMTFLLDGPTIADQDLKHVRLYEKHWGGPFTPLADKAMVHFNFTNHVYRHGMVRDTEAVWMLSDTGQIRRIDLKTGEATTPWQMEDPFNEEARTHGMIFDDYVLYIGAKPGSAKEYIARAYNRKTGEVKLTKTLPLLTNTYGGKDIMHIMVRDPDALYAWLETQPDLKE